MNDLLLEAVIQFVGPDGQAGTTGSSGYFRPDSLLALVRVTRHFRVTLTGERRWLN